MWEPHPPRVLSVRALAQQRRRCAEGGRSPGPATLQKACAGVGTHCTGCHRVARVRPQTTLSAWLSEASNAEPQRQEENPRGLVRQASVPFPHSSSRGF